MQDPGSHSVPQPAFSRRHPSNRLATASQCMARVTLVFIVGMLALNVAAWTMPDWKKYGISLGLTEQGWNVDVRDLAWWQIVGAIALSSLPLLILANGLRHLGALFRVFAQGAHFSTSVAFHLGKVGRAVAWWVLANLLCEPLLSAWVTLLRGPGERLLTLSFTTSSIVALYVAGSIAVIARILARAAEVYEENKQFV